MIAWSEGKHQRQQLALIEVRYATYCALSE
jgi:hypothetical protein